MDIDAADTCACGNRAGEKPAFSFVFIKKSVKFI